MDKLKQYVALAVAASLAIVAGGWFLLVSPKRGEAADLQEQAVQRVAANAVLETQLQVLQAQAKDLPKKQADIARVAAKIPDNPSLPALIRAVTLASTTAGVEFVSITPSAPVAAVPVAVTPVAPETAAAQTTPAAPAVPAPAVSAAGSLSTIPVTFNVVGDYFDVTRFLANLEDLPRALRITNVELAPGKSPTASDAEAATSNDGKVLSALLTGTVFMAADRPVAVAVTVPGGPPPGGAAAPVAPVDQPAAPAPPADASAPTAPAN